MDFKYGDLIIKCHKCGKEQILEELVTEGRAIYMFNREGNNFIKLNCSDCDITMEMKIVPNEKANAEIKDEVEDAVIIEPNEELQEESIIEEIV